MNWSQYHGADRQMVSFCTYVTIVASFNDWKELYLMHCRQFGEDLDSAHAEWEVAGNAVLELMDMLNIKKLLAPDTIHQKGT